MAVGDKIPREVVEIVLFDPYPTPYPLELLEWLDADVNTERKMLVMTPKPGVTITLESEIQDTPARRGQVFQIKHEGRVVAMATTLQGMGANRVIAVLTGEH